MTTLDHIRSKALDEMDRARRNFRALLPVSRNRSFRFFS